NPATLDYASFARRSGANVVGQGGPAEGLPVSAVLWLPPRLTDVARAELDKSLEYVVRRDADSVVLISSLSAHLGDRDALSVEAPACQRVGSLRRRTTIIRTGPVLSKQSRLDSRLRRWAGCSPLVPRRVRACCVEGDELFAMIEAVRKAPRARRLYTLLG